MYFTHFKRKLLIYIDKIEALIDKRSMCVADTSMGSLYFWSFSSSKDNLSAKTMIIQIQRKSDWPQTFPNFCKKNQIVRSSWIFHVFPASFWLKIPKIYPQYTWTSYELIIKENIHFKLFNWKSFLTQLKTKAYTKKEKYITLHLEFICFTITKNYITMKMKK